MSSRGDALGFGNMQMGEENAVVLEGKDLAKSVPDACRS